MSTFLNKVKNLLVRNYYLAKIITYFRFLHRYNQKSLLVVYQMGKVGSSTIVESLKALDLDAPVLHVHFISPRAIREMEERYYGDKITLIQDSLWPETRHLFLSYYLRRVLKDKPLHPKWKIITLIRDPISRSASVFFYSVDTPKQNPYLPDFYNRLNSKTLTKDYLSYRFWEVLNEDKDEFQLPLQYFDKEFKQVTGIDVFESKFPKEQGFAIFPGESFDVLIIKLERMKECIHTAMRRFLGLRDFQLISANQASQKDYYPAYEDFLKSIALPQEYLDKIYNSKFVQHFYTQDEIASFRQRWS